MLTIAERINTVRKRVLRAYEEQDADYLRKLAIRQADAGADVIDVNAGTDIDVEPRNMAWAVKTVQDAVEVPLCIDSANPETIRAGLDACRDKENTWANSVNLEKERMEGILPLVKEYNCPVIGLCMDQVAIPATAEERIEAAKKLVDAVDGYGIPTDKLYLDVLVEPISVAADRGTVCLQTLRGIKAAVPGVKTVICLSAVSFGLPGRRLVNGTYLPLLMSEGVDAVILDVLDCRLMTTLRAADALLGRDEYCMGYIKACRKDAGR